MAQTCLPSVLGEGEAELPSSPITLRLPRPTFCRHSSLPAVLMHSSHRSDPALSADVKKTRSPQTIGVAPAGPGSGKRHSKFLSLLNSAGRPLSPLTPLWLAPRHCGQFSAWAVPMTDTETMKSNVQRRRPRGGIEDPLGGANRKV